ncbi:MAG TPA: hypothetical protein VLJ62_18155, partial [Burkholderiaceae bacterium]|nr:hypothetical protein [Burkholderiaceae bacterium]
MTAFGEQEHTEAQAMSRLLPHRRGVGVLAMNVVRKTLVGGVAVLAFATLVATGLGSSRDEPQPGQTAASPKAVGDTRAHRIPSEAARTLPATVSDAVSLRSWVERLLSPGTPRDRYQAFGVLAQCAHAVDFDRYLKSLPVDPESTRLRERYGDGFARIAAACGDLSARQLDLRVELAASAADEGIPGAASAWVEEGPYGDKTALTQRPDDPLIVEWAQQ